MKIYKAKRMTIILLLLISALSFSKVSINGQKGYIKLLDASTNGYGFLSLSLNSVLGASSTISDNIVESISLSDYFQSTTHFSVSYGLTERIDLNAKISFAYDKRQIPDSSKVSLSDINNTELGFKYSFKNKGLVNFGSYFFITFPVYDELDPDFSDYQNNGNYYYDHRNFSDELLYNNKISGGAKLLTSIGNDKFNFMLNTGYVLRYSTELPDIFTLGAGFDARTSKNTKLFMEYDAEYELNLTHRNIFPQRLGGGLRHNFGEYYYLTYGGYGGLNEESPKWQAFVGFSMTRLVVSLDADKDGIIDKLDKCPKDPEDFDGFEDKDGCPEDDNDKDGVKDLADKCPNIAEDLDGYEDEDGCPEDDNDKDGIKDVDDKCPNEPEDMDGYEDLDGCPELDNDDDGIPDATDKCPNEPEDLDGFEDQDGCPEFDNDQDGIKDTLDKCPNMAETLNGFEDDDGCPDAIILKKDERIVLDNIYFKTGKAELTTNSFPTLNKVKRIFIDNPNIVIQIEGHTDSQGSAAYNLNLSQKRAESVYNYLITELNISSSQIKAVGFGEEIPVASNKSKEGRAKNRRIEFRVISNSQ
ncbi:MAG: OmpA family protein [Candidatus Delongbacteria bacterium]|nr:OmpA family protein [Candidatus Delongbacteria bacterium]